MRMRISPIRSPGNRGSVFAPAFQFGGAFTLVELAVVVFVIGVVVMVTFPRFSGLISGRRLMGFCGKLAGTLDYVRARSVTDGCIYHFNFDKDKNKYWVTREGDEDKPMEGKLGKPQPFPENISLQRVELEKRKGDFYRPAIRFYPRGNSDGAVIYLETVQGDKASVLVKPYTGRSEVFRGYYRG